MAEVEIERDGNLEAPRSQKEENNLILHQSAGNTTLVGACPDIKSEEDSGALSDLGVGNRNRILEFSQKYKQKGNLQGQDSSCPRTRVDTSFRVTSEVCASALPDTRAPKNSLGTSLVRLQLPGHQPSSFQSQVPAHTKPHCSPQCGINPVPGPEEQSVGDTFSKDSE